MTNLRPRIALIHATPVAVTPVMEAFFNGWPEAAVYNLLEDSLAPDLEVAGQLDAEMDERFCTLARYAASCGADGILFTCSAFGTSIEAAAEALAPLPVLKPNEAMFEEAIELGGHVGLLATFEPSIPSMEQEFVDMAAASGGAARLSSICVPDALVALLDGDNATHNRLIAEAAQDLGEVDTILLAQFSMAEAADDVRAKTGKKVLTSPASAVRALKALI